MTGFINFCCGTWTVVKLALLLYVFCYWPYILHDFVQFLLKP